MHIQHPGQVFPLLALACPSWKDCTSGGSGWPQSESPPALWMLGSGEQRKGENNFPQTFLLKDFRSDCHCCVSHLSKPQSFFLLALLFCCLFLSPSGCQVPVSEELNYFRWHLLWGTNRSMFLLPLQWRSRWESAAASEHSLYKFNGRKEATGAYKLPIFPPGVRLFVFQCLPRILTPPEQFCSNAAVSLLRTTQNARPSTEGEVQLVSLKSFTRKTVWVWLDLWDPLAISLSFRHGFVTQNQVENRAIKLWLLRCLCNGFALECAWASVPRRSPAASLVPYPSAAVTAPRASVQGEHIWSSRTARPFGPNLYADLHTSSFQVTATCQESGK